MSRRAIAPKELLEEHSAVPLFAGATNEKNAACSLFQQIATVSDSSSDAEGQPPKPIGINIHGWNIVTSNSPIATEEQEKEFAAYLSAKCDNTKKFPPPELLFYNAFVLVSRSSEDEVGGVAHEGYNKNPQHTEYTKEELKITAKAALAEWAEAHQHFDANTQHDVDQAFSGHRGVSVIKTSHARLWEKARGENTRGEKETPLDKSDESNENLLVLDDLSEITVTKSELYYDWTYSTPYSCDIFFSTSSLWNGCEESGIQKNMNLLTDRTQPILLFDEVLLFEDDLHDNGQVRLSVKVRVMPTCFFLLQRLFLRVDNVIVRCRDTRIFCKFENDEGRDSPHKVYRDIQWRECLWPDLESKALPSDVKAWTEPHVNSLIPHLPIIELPDDIPQHSVHSC